MKKYLFIILLTLICIIPFNVSAESVKNLYLYPTDINLEKYHSLLNQVKEHSTYKEFIEQYSYYLIFYEPATPLDGLYGSYTNAVFVLFFNEIPTWATNYNDMYFEPNSISKVLYYYINSVDNINLTTSDATKRYVPFTWYNADYKLILDGLNYYDASNSIFILETNLDIKCKYNFDLYDINGNFIKSYTTEDNFFQDNAFTLIQEKKEYTIEDILNSDDILYSLSKELIGPLPEEFSFIYSIVSLMLGILVLIVVISPFVLLKRWLM